MTERNNKTRSRRAEVRPNGHDKDFDHVLFEVGKNNHWLEGKKLYREGENKNNHVSFSMPQQSICAGVHGGGGAGGLWIW